MTYQFTAEVFQNQFLPQGTKEVHAIMTVTAGNQGLQNSTGGKIFGIICDVSGSMGGEKIQSAKNAMISLVNLLPEDAYFFIIIGSDKADVIFSPSPANFDNKNLAISAIRKVEANGGTCISKWLKLALEQFKNTLNSGKIPANSVRQALLLTDGQNAENSELVDQVLADCEGMFQCDCRGVGTDWQVKQLQLISNKLLGTTDIIHEPSLIEADFQAILQKAMTKNISDVTLRLWHPQGAKIKFCKQVSPEIIDLTNRSQQIKPQINDYPTGAWGQNESRDYHFCIEVITGNVGDEMLAGRASLIYRENGGENKIAEAKILAIWTDDDVRSTKLDKRVAHYTGQGELAQSIQEGLEARDRGDMEIATVKLGKAVKLAHDSGNESTAKLLRKVVDVEDAATGTIKLKRNVTKEDTMTLETRSTKTTRIPKS